MAAADAGADLNAALFGSSDDEDAAPPPPAAPAVAPPAEPRAASPPPGAAAPQMHLAAPLVPSMSRPGDRRLLRLTKLPAVDATPYDAATFAPPPPADESAAAAVEAAVRAVTTARCRKGAGGGWESNARMVTWSDGSSHLFVGADAFTVADAPLSGPGGRAYVAARHAEVVQVVGALPARLSLAPATLASAAHRGLAAALDARHARASRVRVAAMPLEAPAAAHARLVADEEARNKAVSGLGRRQRAARAKGAGPRQTRYERLTEAYLEAGDDVDEEEDEGEGATAGERARAALARRPAAAGGADRLTAAQRDDEDDDMDGFIADEEVEVGGVAGGEEEAEASSGGDDGRDEPDEAPPARAPVDKKRRVLSDSD